MHNTIAALLGIGIVIAGFTIFGFWAKFCFKVSKGSDWGMGLMISPFPIVLLAFTIYKDLSA